MRVIEAARKRRGTHNEKRPLVARRIIDMLLGRYKEALVRTFRERRFSNTALEPADGPDNVTSIFDRDTAPDPTAAAALARGEAPPEGWEAEVRSRLRARPEVKEALERMLARALRRRAAQRSVRLQRARRVRRTRCAQRRRAGAPAPAPRA